ncbi:hypothetical protein [Microbacterium thalassium]|uniref:Nitrate ABC transporter substrate-binding protein n=1 Tax=Microbacterium thalassium TaxID=362649 RepID=A0A7X0FR89_9MICO|nr:hypothetical protein [Microbacterium thalassium]MBB6392217.1 hypothetical protein [Microbacterium thalassium]GLK23428.1 hypothetical protein GCM10017607_07460 [Microbacterium thalassium]
MSFPLRRLGASVLVAGAMLAVTACSTAADPEAEPTAAVSETPIAVADEPESTPEPAPAGDATEVTCESMLPASTVADFASIGWTYQEQPFWAGEVELADGVLCVWADYEAQAGDHLQMFGWSPIDADSAVTAQDSLLSQGWIREEDEQGVYITENPETTIATDADGYGMTFLFGDGWVKMSDTKQGIILVG